MKVVPLSEVKAKLSRYGQMCHREPVVVTVNGRPSFQLAPLGEDDDLVDRLLAEHPAFRRLLESRLKEPAVPAPALLGRFGIKSAAGRPKTKRNR